MKKKYEIHLTLFLLLLLQCFPIFMNAQVTFEDVYPIPPSINQSGRDVLPTSDGGYLIAGMTMNNTPNDSDIYMVKTDYQGNILWTKTYGGPQPDYAHKIIPIDNGNFFVLGFTMSYGAGSYDIWLLKIDPNGVILWSQTYGTTAWETGHEIIPTSDGNYMITGESNRNALLMKIDPNGVVLWQQSYGGAQYETSHSVKQCLDNGYIFVGQTYTYGQGAGDIYVVKTDDLGNVSWTKTFGGIYTDEGKFVLANPDGSFIIDGQISSSNAPAGLDINVISLDAGGNTNWNQTYGGNDKDVTHMIQNTSDGGYIIAGISRSFGWINPNMWLVKTDGGGNIIWTSNFGSWYHDHCYAVKQTSDGGYIALGHQEDINNYTHVFFVKTDGLGLVQVEEYASNPAFSVYPNPTKGNAQIDLQSISDEKVLLRLINSFGQILISETIDVAKTTGNRTIDLKGKEPGVYFVTILSAKNISTKKIVLE